MPRIADPRFAPDCSIEVDGAPVPARAGESVAAALVAAGRFVIGRSTKYHRPRGPFCLTGTCHSCLARIDGVPNRRTCRVAVVPGRTITTQNALPTARHDLLAAIDRVYPTHLDHHHLVTWNALANRAMVAISRKLTGTGTLPDGAPPRSRAPVEQRFDVAVIGAGPAGLAAAESAAAEGRRVVLVEAERRAGGRLRSGLGVPGSPPARWIDDVLSAIQRNGEVWTGVTAFGVWPDGPTVRISAQEEQDEGAPDLRLARAAAVVLATGSHALPPVAPRNDLPGIFAGRAVARLLAEDGVVPGWRCVVAGEGQEASLVADALARAGVALVTTRQVVSIDGGVCVRHVLLEDGERVSCDALVWCGPRAATWELARSAGVAIRGDAPAAWGLRADERGLTAVPGVLVAGDVAGPISIPAAIEAGRRAGEAAARDAH